MWGIGALAMSPDAIPEGPRRRRLVRAATLTSVMGLAWASTAGGAPPSNRAPSFDHLGLPSVGADEDAMRLSSPLPGSWQQLHDDRPSSDEEVASAPDAASAPGVQDPKARKREQATEVTARREARPAEDQGQTKGADAANGKARAAADQKGKGTSAAAEADEKTPAPPEKGEQKEQQTATKGAGNKVSGKKAAAADKGAGKGAAAQAKGAQPGGKPASVRAAQQSRDVSAAPDPDAWRTNVVARHENVEFVQMSDTTVLVGFHEAAMPGAKALAPAARLDADQGRSDVPASAVDDDLHTMILPTRARATGAASAMDVVIPARETVFAPVTGTVTEVDHYKLYGTHPDNRLVIVPDARPDLRVVILHVEGVKVSPGDEVTAGQTKIAVGANPFTFESQIDRFAAPLMPRKGDATPHVHVELR